MWPTLLNMSPDDCRRTLRRLELEAYSNMIDVFRAQGALEDSRKKILEELRAVLHIGSDRHSAEARRVANDELLATIAEHLAGPNTGLGWIKEGRRRVPLMPRGIPQTAYTELADRVAEATAIENKALLHKQELLEAEMLSVPKTEEEMPDAEGDTAESALTSSEAMDDIKYPPIAMEDQTTKIWETELLSRKRKVPEGGAIPDDATTPVKNIRNIQVNTNQKHLNLSQIYSKFSQPPTSKSSGQSKHSYNQVSKVSTSRSQSHTPRAPAKQRAPRQPKQAQKIALSKLQKKQQQQQQQMQQQQQLQQRQQELSPSKYAAVREVEYGNPNSFQARYAQAVLGRDAPPAPATPATPAPVPAPAAPRRTLQGTPAQLIIKKRGDLAPAVSPAASPAAAPPAAPAPAPSGGGERRVHMSDVKVLQAPPGGGGGGKLLAAKVLGVRPPAQPGAGVRPPPPARPEAPPQSPAPAPSKKIVISSGGTPAPPGKGLPATDIKVSSAKTFLLNPKSGAKMVVVPARPKPAEGQLPMIHFKGVPTTMRLVPVGSQSPAPPAAPAPAPAAPGTPHAPRVLSVEPIKTANMADIVPVKGLPSAPASAPARARPLARAGAGRGNVIVVQKSATIGKALAFSKNNSDMSKIIMGKNVNRLLQASKLEPAESAAGNVIVLELNDDQARPTTMSEILDTRGTPAEMPPAPRAPRPPQEAPAPAPPPPPVPPPAPAPAHTPGGEARGADKERGSSSVTDWEMELDTASRKDEDGKDDDKLNSLHLDLGMSSDSEHELTDADTRARTEPPRAERGPARGLAGAAHAGESREAFESSSGLSHATRTLLSQLHDEGSSSNDSSFALKAKPKLKEADPKPDTLDKSESDALSKAKAKLSEKVAKSQKRIDVYSTAISTADINLDAFSYLDEGMMAGEVMLDDADTDSPAASETSPHSKQ